MDKIEQLNISRLVSNLKQDNYVEAMENLQNIVKFKQEKIKEQIVNEAFQDSKQGDSK